MVPSELPVQPVFRDGAGVVRFRPNRMVVRSLDLYPGGLPVVLAKSRDERVQGQFLQLIGLAVGSYQQYRVQPQGPRIQRLLVGAMPREADPWEHPLQPVIRGADGKSRFQSNPLVEVLAETVGLPRSPREDPRDDSQVSQLLGWPVSIWAALHPEDAARAGLNMG